MTTSLSQEILAIAKSATLVSIVLAPAALAAKLVYSNPDVLVELTDRMQAVEIGNTKIEFGEKAFVLNQDLAKLSFAGQRKIQQLIKRLSSYEVDRLLHLPEYDRDHLSDDDLRCDYDNASSRMRLYAAADQGLIEKSLVERVSRPDLTKKLQNTIKTPSEIGYPSNCYQMALTKDGSDLKSVIVSELTRAFGNAPEKTVEMTSEKPSPKKTKDELSRARYAKSASLANGQ